MSAPTLGYSDGRHVPADKAMLAGARLYYATIGIDPPCLGPIFDLCDPDSGEADDLIIDARILGLEGSA